MPMQSGEITCSQYQETLKVFRGAGRARGTSPGKGQAKSGGRDAGKKKFKEGPQGEDKGQLERGLWGASQI